MCERGRESKMVPCAHQPGFGFRFRVSGFGFRVSGVGFRGLGVRGGPLLWERESERERESET